MKPENTSPIDTAALAAGDDTNTKTLGDHVLISAGSAASQDQPPQEEAPEIPSTREAELILEVASLKERIVLFEGRREKEQSLLSQRDASIHAIEGAKARVAAEKQGLAEIEEQIAALLREPLPVPFGETPIGKAIDDAKASATPWESVLPSVSPEQVRILDASAGEELPTVDALASALLTDTEMAGEVRKVKTVMVYGTPWIVTHYWWDGKKGLARANTVRLYTKDEWSQLHEAQFGRAVQVFDQTDEAKSQRQFGGIYCGLVVKVGKKSYVVGPQKDALHLAYAPPEPNMTPQAADEPATEEDLFASDPDHGPEEVDPTTGQGV